MILVQKFSDKDLQKYYETMFCYIEDIICCKYGNFFIQELLERFKTNKMQYEALKLALDKAEEFKDPLCDIDTYLDDQ